jgi:hypothetical protein
MKKIANKFFLGRSFFRVIAPTLLFLFFCGFSGKAQISQYVNRVVLQGFWWDYWNNNYRFSWANYLTDLAPRLKSLGIDAVWIPPSAKNASPGSVGYVPFDMYDLGDKFQKGFDSTSRVFTRSGTKDELLRLIAVLHANGIEVIEDMVLNHNADANALGGRDPEPNYSVKSADGYKNFRFVSYKTPYIDDSQNDYWTRSGRFAKNYQNFHPNAANNCTAGDICTAYWGPDLDYGANAFGQSTNIPKTGNATIKGITRPYYNPVQTSSYSLNGANENMAWFKKQTGVDGFRFDAVKHFLISAQNTFISNVINNLPDWAKGGENMLSIGEWIGSASDQDGYCAQVGGQTHTGTFDFSLRAYDAFGYGGFYSMVLGNGGFNMQLIPLGQQNFRYKDYGSKRVYRTVPFINSHDTFRPFLDTCSSCATQGNYRKPLGDASGWDLSNELGGNGKHIDPREPRLAAAYAAATAVDGNPMFYFEDLFDIGTTGKRWRHLPNSETDLPVRKDLQNIIQAHQKLDFKKSGYGVPTALTGGNAPVYAKGSSGDHLVIERAGKAIIGVTDAFSSVTDNSADQEAWVTADASMVGKVLYDYSGAHGLSTTTVFGDRRVLIKTAPNGHNIPSAYGHGYSIWAPAPDGITFNTVQDMYNYIATYEPVGKKSTTQEWEMADDLGDSHCKSLGQGGRIPDNLTNERVVGRIFAAVEQQVTIKLLPETDGRDLTVSIYKTDGTLVATQSGMTTAANPVTLNYFPSSDGWLVIKVRNTIENQAGQRCWVNVTYTAPQVVDTKAELSVIPTNVSIWTGNKATTDVADCGNWEGGLVPNQTSHVIVYGHAKPFPVLKTNITVNKVTVHPGAQFTVDPGINLTVLSQ